MQSLEKWGEIPILYSRNMKKISKFYKRTCKKCDERFETMQKYSEMCESCKDKNHKRKIIMALNLSL